MGDAAVGDAAVGDAVMGGGAASLAFYAAAVLYVAATTLYFLYLARGGKAQQRWGTGALAAASAAHVACLAIGISDAQHALAGIRHALAWVSLLVSLGYLVSMRGHRLPVLGAFVAPLALILFLGAGLPGHQPVPSEVRSALLPLHVGVNVLGMVAFTLAFAAAVAYVLQERLLRRKRIGRLLQRLPPLDVLDALGLRLVTIGFPLFTVGVITGSVWAARMAPDAGLSAGQTMAMVAWAFFGTVLIARVAAGWRGRRAAIGTMLGFTCSMAAMLGYVFEEL